jgi:leucine dehydrogenase
MSTYVADPGGPAAVLGGGEGLDHEQLLVRRGDRTGLYTVVAVHSTALGPALGGCRMWRYATLQGAVDDALRLSRAMTLKAAAARLPLGGGKGVLWLPPGLEPSPALRHEMLRDFADTVNELDGRYITAEDVGTTSRDMAVLAGFCRYVVGRPTDTGGAGDPGDFTAAGVQAAMRACLAHLYGSPELEGHTVSVVGLGSVGAHLARRLARAGAALVVSDIDPRKVSLARELGAEWAEPDDALLAEVDVLAPCALGGVFDDERVPELRCRVVCGAANNQLVHDDVADRLAAREILYAPDFIVNVGGLINVSLELGRYDSAQALRRVAEIEPTLARVLAHAQQTGVTPLAAATELAQRWLGAAADDCGRPGPDAGLAAIARIAGIAAPAARAGAGAGEQS